MLMLGQAQGVISLNVAPLEQGVDTALGSLGQLERNTGRGLNRLDNDLQAIGLSTTKVGAGLVGMGTLLGAPLVVGIKNATNLEQAFKNVEVALGDVSKQDMSKLQRQIQDIGADGEYSAQQIAEVAESLAKAGYDTDDLMSGDGFGNMMKAVSDLSSATGDGLDSATTGIVAAMSTWDAALVGPEVGLRDAAQAADILTVAANESSADLNGIIAGMRNLGPVAAQMGVGFDESAAAIALFTNNGLKGADAGISLMRGMQNLADPTSEASKMMEQYGIAGFDAQGKFIGFPKLFDQLNKGLSGLSDQQKLTALSTIFGAEAMDVMGLAILQGGDPLRELIKQMEQGGIASAQAAERTNTLSGSIQRLQEGLGTALGVLMQSWIGPIRFVADALDWLISKFMDLPQPIKSAIGIIAGLTAGLMVLSGGFLLAAPRALEFIRTIRALATISGPLGAASRVLLRMGGLASPLVGLASAIMRVVSASRLLKVALGGFVGIAWLANLAYDANFLGFGDWIDVQVGRAKKAWDSLRQMFGMTINATPDVKFKPGDYMQNSVYSEAGSGADGKDWFVLGPDGKLLGEIIDSKAYEDGRISMDIRFADGSVQQMWQDASTGEYYWGEGVGEEPEETLTKAQMFNKGMDGIKESMSRNGYGFATPIVSGVQKIGNALISGNKKVQAFGKWYDRFNADFREYRKLVGLPQKDGGTYDWFDRMRSVLSSSLRGHGKMKDFAIGTINTMERVHGAFTGAASKIAAPINKFKTAFGTTWGILENWGDADVSFVDKMSRSLSSGFRAIGWDLAADGALLFGNAVNTIGSKIKGGVQAVGTFKTAFGTTWDIFEKWGDADVSFVDKMSRSLSSGFRAIGWDLAADGALFFGKAVNTIGSKIKGGVQAAGTFRDAFQQSMDLQGKTAGTGIVAMSGITGAEKVLQGLAAGFRSIGWEGAAQGAEALAGGIAFVRNTMIPFVLGLTAVKNALNIVSGMFPAVAAGATAFIGAFALYWKLAGLAASSTSGMGQSMGFLEKVLFSLSGALRAVGLDGLADMIDNAAPRILWAAEMIGHAFSVIKDKIVSGLKLAARALAVGALSAVFAPLVAIAAALEDMLMPKEETLSDFVKGVLRYDVDNTQRMLPSTAAIGAVSAALEMMGFEDASLEVYDFALRVQEAGGALNMIRSAARGAAAGIRDFFVDLIKSDDATLFGFNISNMLENLFGKGVEFSINLMLDLIIDFFEDPSSQITKLLIGLIGAGAIILSITGGVSAFMVLAGIFGIGLLSLMVFNAVQDYFDNEAHRKKINAKISIVLDHLEKIPVFGWFVKFARFYTNLFVLPFINGLLAIREALHDLGGPFDYLMDKIERGYMLLVGYGLLQRLGSGAFLGVYTKQVGKSRQAVAGLEAAVYGLFKLIKLPIKMVFQPLDLVKEILGGTRGREIAKIMDTAIGEVGDLKMADIADMMRDMRILPGLAGNTTKEFRTMSLVFGAVFDVLKIFASNLGALFYPIRFVMDSIGNASSFLKKYRGNLNSAYGAALKFDDLKIAGFNVDQKDVDRMQDAIRAWREAGNTKWNFSAFAESDEFKNAFNIDLFPDKGARKIRNATQLVEDDLYKEFRLLAGRVSKSAAKIDMFGAWYDPRRFVMRFVALFSTIEDTLIRKGGLSKLVGQYFFGWPKTLSKAFSLDDWVEDGARLTEKGAKGWRGVVNGMFDVGPLRRFGAAWSNLTWMGRQWRRVLEASDPSGALFKSMEEAPGIATRTANVIDDVAKAISGGGWQRLVDTIYEATRAVSKFAAAHTKLAKTFRGLVSAFAIISTMFVGPLVGLPALLINTGIVHGSKLLYKYLNKKYELFTPTVLKRSQQLSQSVESMAEGLADYRRQAAAIAKARRNIIQPALDAPLSLGPGAGYGESFRMIAPEIRIGPPAPPTWQRTQIRSVVNSNVARATRSYSQVPLSRRINVFTPQAQLDWTKRQTRRVVSTNANRARKAYLETPLVKSGDIYGPTSPPAWARSQIQRTINANVGSMDVEYRRALQKIASRRAIQLELPISIPNVAGAADEVISPVTRPTAARAVSVQSEITDVLRRWNIENNARRAIIEQEVLDMKRLARQSDGIGDVMKTIDEPLRDFAKAWDGTPDEGAIRFLDWQANFNERFATGIRNIDLSKGRLQQVLDEVTAVFRANGLTPELFDPEWEDNVRKSLRALRNESKVLYRDLVKSQRANYSKAFKRGAKGWSPIWRAQDVPVTSNKDSALLATMIQDRLGGALNSKLIRKNIYDDLSLTLRKVNLNRTFDAVFDDLFKAIDDFDFGTNNRLRKDLLQEMRYINRDVGRAFTTLEDGANSIDVSGALKARNNLFSRLLDDSPNMGRMWTASIGRIEIDSERAMQRIPQVFQKAADRNRASVRLPAINWSRVETFGDLAEFWRLEDLGLADDLLIFPEGMDRRASSAVHEFTRTLTKQGKPLYKQVDSFTSNLRKLSKGLDVSADDLKRFNTDLKKINFFADFDLAGGAVDDLVRSITNLPTEVADEFIAEIMATFDPKNLANSETFVRKTQKIARDAQKAQNQLDEAFAPLRGLLSADELTSLTQMTDSLVGPNVAKNIVDESLETIADMARSSGATDEVAKGFLENLRKAFRVDDSMGIVDMRSMDAADMLGDLLRADRWLYPALGRVESMIGFGWRNTVGRVRNMLANRRNRLIEAENILNAKHIDAMRPKLQGAINDLTMMIDDMIGSGRITGPKRIAGIDDLFTNIDFSSSADEIADGLRSSLRSLNLGAEVAGEIETAINASIRGIKVEAAVDVAPIRRIFSAFTDLAFGAFRPFTALSLGPTRALFRVATSVLTFPVRSLQFIGSQIMAMGRNFNTAAGWMQKVFPSLARWGDAGPRVALGLGIMSVASFLWAKNIFGLKDAFGGVVGTIGEFFSTMYRAWDLNGISGIIDEITESFVNMANDIPGTINTIVNSPAWEKLFQIFAIFGGLFIGGGWGLAIGLLAQPIANLASYGVKAAGRITKAWSEGGPTAAFNQFGRELMGITRKSAKSLMDFGGELMDLSRSVKGIPVIGKPLSRWLKSTGEDFRSFAWDLYGVADRYNELVSGGMEPGQAALMALNEQFPFFGNALDAVRQKIKKYQGPLRGMLDGFLGIKDGVGEVIGGLLSGDFGRAGRGLQKIGKSMTGLVASTSRLARAIATDLLTGAIRRFPTLANELGKVRLGVFGIFSGIANMAQGLGKIISGDFIGGLRDMWLGARQIFTGLGNLAQGLWGLFRRIDWTAAFAGINVAWDNFTNWIATSMGGLEAQAGGYSLSTTIGIIVDWAIEAVTPLWDALSNWIMSALGADGGAGGVGAGIGAAAAGRSRKYSVGEVALEIANWAMPALGSLYRRFQDWINSEIAQINWASVSDKLRELGDEFTNLEWVFDSLAGVIDTLRTAFSNIGSTLDTLGLTGVKDAIKGIAQHAAPAGLGLLVLGLAFGGPIGAVRALWLPITLFVGALGRLGAVKWLGIARGIGDVGAAAALMKLPGPLKMAGLLLLAGLATDFPLLREAVMLVVDALKWLWGAIEPLVPGPVQKFASAIGELAAELMQLYMAYMLIKGLGKFMIPGMPGGVPGRGKSGPAPAPSAGAPKRGGSGGGGLLQRARGALKPIADNKVVRAIATGAAMWIPRASNVVRAIVTGAARWIPRASAVTAIAAVPAAIGYSWYRYLKGTPLLDESDPWYNLTPAQVATHSETGSATGGPIYGREKLVPDLIAAVRRGRGSKIPVTMSGDGSINVGGALKFPNMSLGRDWLVKNLFPNLPTIGGNRSQETQPQPFMSMPPTPKNLAMPVNLDISKLFPVRSMPPAPAPAAHRAGAAGPQPATRPIEDPFRQVPGQIGQSFGKMPAAAAPGITQLQSRVVTGFDTIRGAAGSTLMAMPATTNLAFSAVATGASTYTSGAAASVGMNTGTMRMVGTSNTAGMASSMGMSFSTLSGTAAMTTSSALGYVSTNTAGMATVGGGNTATMAALIGGGMSTATGHVSGGSAAWVGIIMGRSFAMAAAGMSAGLMLSLGVARGIDAGLPAVQAAANRVISTATRAMTFAAIIRSPSRLTANMIGTPMTEGVGVGMTSSEAFRSLDSAATDISDYMATKTIDPMTVSTEASKIRAASSARSQAGSATYVSNKTVGDINVTTQATDAEGTAAAVVQALDRAFGDVGRVK